MQNYSSLKYLTKADIQKIIDLAEIALNSRATIKSNKPQVSDIKATSEELKLLNELKAMSFKTQRELCALMLLGRAEKEKGSEPADLKDFMQEAERVEKTGIVHYLFEKPLADYLREGLLKTFP